MAKQKQEARYQINPRFQGKTVWTKQPPYERKKPAGRFVLDESLSEKDKDYLYNVIGLTEHITKQEPSAEPAAEE